MEDWALHVKPFFQAWVWSWEDRQRMWTLRNREWPDRTVSLFHQGPSPRDFPRLECNAKLSLCPLLSLFLPVYLVIVDPFLLSVHALLLHFFHILLLHSCCVTTTTSCSVSAQLYVSEETYRNDTSRRSRPHWDVWACIWNLYMSWDSEECTHWDFLSRSALNLLAPEGLAPNHLGNMENSTYFKLKVMGFSTVLVSVGFSYGLTDWILK